MKSKRCYRGGTIGYEEKGILLLSGSVVWLVFVVFAFAVGGALSNTPTTPSPNAACTPTPPVRHPTFTVGPGERATPNVVSTNIAVYQATYPGDHIVPARDTDLAPQVPFNDKASVVIRHADCSYEQFLVSKDQLPTFASTYLKPGDSLYAQSAPPAARVHQEPPTGVIGQRPGVPVNTSGTPITNQPTIRILSTPSLGDRQTAASLLALRTPQSTVVTTPIP